MNSPLKYPGGKNKELNFIIPNLPRQIDRFFEPFVGGGAVYFNISSVNQMFINDKSYELVNFYRAVRGEDKEFISTLKSIDNTLKFLINFTSLNSSVLLNIYQSFKEHSNHQTLLEELSYFFDENQYTLQDNVFIHNLNYVTFYKQLVKSVTDKYKRTKRLEEKKGFLEKEDDIINNIETGLMSAYYTFNRYVYNNCNTLNLALPIQSALYFYIREYCYSSMFRYNQNGEFNVPYGGMSYNHKFLSKKIDYLSNTELVNHLNNTVIDNLDFHEFLETYRLTDKDFIFLDPPYDTEFSTYANNTFDLTDQQRLANYLINECPAKFMLVIKNSDLIRELYNENIITANEEPLQIFAFTKKYLVSFKNRNDKNAEHLLITNYEL